MSEAIEILRVQRNSLEAARTSTYEGSADASFIRGLRAGLNIAVEAIDSEIACLESWTLVVAAKSAAEQQGEKQ